MKLSEKAEFNRIINEIKSDSKSMKMKDFIQHGRVTTYDHCIRVAAISFWIAKKLKLNCNLDSLVKGAFLHDYYLYDWHDYKGAKLAGIIPRFILRKKLIQRLFRSLYARIRNKCR